LTIDDITANIDERNPKNSRNDIILGLNSDSNLRRRIIEIVIISTEKSDMGADCCNCASAINHLWNGIWAVFPIIEKIIKKPEIVWIFEEKPPFCIAL
jgi:hypothetical protein